MHQPQQQGGKQMNKNFHIKQTTDEIIITNNEGYPYIRITDPDNENPKAKEIAEKIIRNIDLTEMIKD